MSRDSDEPCGPARIVVVVPGHDTQLYQYLARSFADISTIKVVLDRRRQQSDGAPPGFPDERRRSATVERRVLDCTLIECPAAASPPPPKPLRDRLWPALRAEDFTLIPPGDE